jgi:anaerobic ribonucleoside-triphosphate reductase activating protein
MNIARILCPVESLGPGKRIVIWTAGCSKKCANCASPEFWRTNDRQSISVEKLSKIIIRISEEENTDKLTISGGDPLEQPDELLSLLKSIRNAFHDVLIYTGYTFEQLEILRSKEYLDDFRKYCDVLIDGPYIDAENRSGTALTGSGNQRIIFFHDELKPEYDAYLKEGRKIQNIYVNDRMISIGIHGKEE